MHPEHPSYLSCGSELWARTLCSALLVLAFGLVGATALSVALFYRDDPASGIVTVLSDYPVWLVLAGGCAGHIIHRRRR